MRGVSPVLALRQLELAGSPVVAIPDVGEESKRGWGTNKFVDGLFRAYYKLPKRARLTGLIGSYMLVIGALDVYYTNCDTSSPFLRQTGTHGNLATESSLCRSVLDFVASESR
jgi:hypothetical protein